MLKRKRNEKDLALRLGVNNATVHESLRIKELMRVRDLRQENSIEAIVCKFLEEDGLKLEVIHDLHEAVLHVESIMARLAAERRTDSELSALEAIYDKMKLSLDSSYNFTLADMEFHLFIGKMAKSTVFLQLANTIWIMLEKYVYLLYGCEKNRAVAFKHNEELYQAIKEQLPDAAYKINWEHYLWAREALLAKDGEE